MNRTEHELELMRLYLEGVASLEETQELEALIVRDASVRQDFLRYSHLDSALAGVRRSQPSVVAPRRSVWLSWRPLTAAAAGIVFGVFCTSVVFGYSMPQMAKHLLALANAGFEEPVAPLPDGIPLRYGVWSGDYAEVVGEHQGIVPHEGKRMFRFLRSDSTAANSDGATFNGNLYQLVDVRTWREEIANGTAVVDWSAWFNSVPDRGHRKTKFVASVWAFAGDTSLVRKNWEEKLHQELAYSSWKIIADDDPISWQRIAGSMIVPPDTDFLVIQLKAIPGKAAPVDGAVSFPGQYADDVQLVLRTSARQQPAALTSTEP